MKTRGHGRASCAITGHKYIAGRSIWNSTFQPIRLNDAMLVMNLMRPALASYSDHAVSGGEPGTNMDVISADWMIGKKHAISQYDPLMPEIQPPLNIGRE